MVKRIINKKKFWLSHWQTVVMTAEKLERKGNTIIEIKKISRQNLFGLVGKDVTDIIYNNPIGFNV